MENKESKGNKGDRKKRNKFFDHTIRKSAVESDLVQFLNEIGFEVTEHKFYYGIKIKRLDPSKFPLTSYPESNKQE